MGGESGVGSSALRSQSTGDVASRSWGGAQKAVGLPQQCFLLVAASVCASTRLSQRLYPAPLPHQLPQAHHVLLSVALGFLLLILKCLNSLFPDT